MNNNATGAVLRSRSASLGRELGPALVASALTAVVWAAGWLAPLERSIGDILLHLTNRGSVDAPVAAVVIDDRSIAAYGPLPWSRAIVADLVVASRRAGAKAVALDMLLVEARDRAGDLKLARALQAGPSLMAAALGRNGRWLLPLPLFGGAGSAAHVHAEIGPDGVARTLLATKQAGRLSLPALSLAAAREVRPDLVIEPGTVLEPDFRPAPDQVTKVSAIGLLSPASTGGVLNGRVVFIGVTATGSGDRFVVPTSPGPAPSPGVLVHASATASILANGLVHRPGPVWVLCGILLAALAPQILRTRVGAFQPWAVTVVVLAVLLSAGAALELGHLLVPTAPVFVAVVLSVALREGVESQAAQRETGHLLYSLLRHHEPYVESAVPRGSASRLAILRELQEAVLRQDAARRTLLDSMRDGVLMWDRSGRTAVVNPAATHLWGEEPRREDLLDVKPDHKGPSPAIVHRRGREVAVDILTVGDGGMALLRDVTAERELERKRRDMQRLVSHELKTPLASIAGFGETLQRYQLTADEQQQVASLIHGESLRLGEMVTTFLDLERLGSGQMEEAMAPVNLAELCEERLQILSQAARARNQTIASRLDDAVVVRGSAALLARVVDNLVGNAIKYSNEGGVIEVSVARNGGLAVLVVADDGQGIAEEALPRLFERFYRVPGVKGAGSGLGLAVANEVVDWHGGCIRVDSIVGEGSTFTVSLPAED